MPKITESNAPIQSDDDLGPYRSVALARGGGLTQFGANHETLGPGAKSALFHWHSDEDEMVYMLTGELTVHEGDATYPLRAGEAATFRAGEPAGHFVENTGESEASYLVIGTRAQHDRVTYPRHDRVLIRNREDDTVSWETLDGEASSRVNPS